MKATISAELSILGDNYTIGISGDSMEGDSPEDLAKAILNTQKILEGGTNTDDN